MKRILITGFFGVNNLGDDIMLKCFCEKIFESSHKIDITLLLLYGENLNIDLPPHIKIIKLNKIKYGKSLIIKYILSKRYDSLFWIGGTCFTDKAGDGLYKYMKIFKLRGKQFGYIGVGIGNILDSKRREQMKFLVENASLITFRDINSYKIATKITHNKNMFLCEDLVYLMDDYYTLKKDYNRKKLVISWRSFDIYYEKCIEDKAIDILCGFIEKIQHDFEEIIIMPIGNEIDSKKNKKIYLRLNETINIDKIKFYSFDKIYDKIQNIKSANLFISGRLHGIFISEINDINTIAIGYDNKIQNFLVSINKVEDLIYPEKFSIDRLMEKYKKRNSVEKLNFKEQYNKAELNIQYFIKFLNEKEC